MRCYKCNDCIDVSTCFVFTIRNRLIYYTIIIIMLLLDETTFNLPTQVLKFLDLCLDGIPPSLTILKMNIINKVVTTRAGEPANSFPAPAPDFFFKRLRLLVFFSSGSGSGSKEPKTPGSDRLRLLTIG